MANETSQPVRRRSSETYIMDFAQKNKLLREECSKLHPDDENTELTLDGYYELLFHGMPSVDERELKRLPERVKKWEVEQQQWREARENEISAWMESHPNEKAPAFGSFPKTKPRWTSGDEKLITFVVKGHTYFRKSISNAYEVTYGRDDIFVCPVAFYEGKKADKYITWIYALAIDLDFIKSDELRRILRLFARGTYPAPTMVVNSGRGLHLYYVLDEPLYTYPSVRRDASELYETMHLKLSRHVPSVDKHSLGQAYRPVGALTKFQKVVTGYRYGEYWSIQELADAFGYVWHSRTPHHRPTAKMIKYAKDLSRQLGTALPDLNDYDSVHAFIQEGEEKSGNVVTTRMQEYADFLAAEFGVDKPDYNGFAETQDFIARWHERYQEKKDQKKKAPRRRTRKDWYYSTVDRTRTDTQPGHRYYSCVAICVIAYKCGISKEELTDDLNSIADAWELREEWLQDPFHRSHLEDALRCYSEKYAHVTRPQLEDWLGWEFTGKPKKDRMPQQVFLKTEAERKVRTTQRAIADAIRAHPTAKKGELAKLAGVSRPTLNKHLDAARKILSDEQNDNSEKTL